MSNILITGGTGLIGRYLTTYLQLRGHEVAILSRKPGNKIKTFVWDVHNKQIDKEAVMWPDVIVHLAGSGIADRRWSAQIKKEIIDSRVDSAKLLFDAVMEHNPDLKAFVSSSAIGYYGMVTTDHIFTEKDPPSNDFLGEVCHKWEVAADRFVEAGIRTVKVRTGVVLTPEDGPLKKMAMPARFGLAAGLGTGKQYMPWIHIDDLCGMYLKAIEDETMDGPYNAITADYKTSTEFNRSIAKALNKPFWSPNVPSFVLKLMFGEMAQVFLTGSRISPEKMVKSGFQFQYPELEVALQDLLTSKP